MVLDHQGEEEGVERGAARRAELTHLGVGEHAGHPAHVTHVVVHRAGARTGSPHAVSHPDMVAISGSCALRILAASALTSAFDALVSARAAISTACR